MFHIRDKKIDSPVIVGPMAGISNQAFLELCFEFSAGLVYTEMVSDKAIYYGNVRTRDMIKISDDLHPVSMQLFGSEMQTMVYAAKVLDNETNCDFIDINMGCPANKVVKTGAGSAMMKNEDNTVSIVRQIVKEVKKPVTVKMRLGWDSNNMNYLSLGKKLEDVGVSLIALHARTRSQMYEGHSDWSHIKNLKENLSIPVIGNGDVRSIDDFIEMKDSTSCDGVMIARALVGDPFLIKEISNYLEGKENIRVTDDMKFDYCLRHAQKLMALHGERLAISQMRGLAPHYLSGMYGAAKYRRKMNSIDSYEDLADILDEYREYLKNI